MTTSWLSVRTIPHLAAVWACVLVCTSACFLRNCPTGGKKRSQDDTYAPIAHRRECLRCGPGETGQCVGPRICCGESLGCLIGTPETATCHREKLRVTPCHVQGNICGNTGEGNCVARGVCCAEDRCWLDAQCQRATNSGADLDRRSRVTTFVRYVRRLLKKQEADVRPFYH